MCDHDGGSNRDEFERWGMRSATPPSPFGRTFTHIPVCSSERHRRRDYADGLEGTDGGETGDGPRRRSMAVRRAAPRKATRGSWRADGGSRRGVSGIDFFARVGVETAAGFGPLRKSPQNNFMARERGELLSVNDRTRTGIPQGGSLRHTSPWE